LRWGGALLKGVPIGNLSSQIFANIYLNELDRFVKQDLRIKCYFRYADDFVIVDRRIGYLKSILAEINEFLQTRLKIELHPNKVSIRKFRQGVDFLGYVILPRHIVLRTKTRKRMFRKLFEKQKLMENHEIGEFTFGQSLQSYLGLFKHCNGYDLKNILINNFSIKR
jgi:RNA-directed DNA polymerase